jgi:hypothetical protein
VIGVDLDHVAGVLFAHAPLQRRRDRAIPRARQARFGFTGARNP